MNAQTETSESGVLDIIKLLISAVVLVGGLYSYYYYVEVSLPLRVLMVLGGLALGIEFQLAHPAPCARPAAAGVRAGCAS